MVYSVQVKRLRHEEPIDALVVRGTKRKRTTDDESDDPYVFRLVRTYDKQQETNNRVLLEGSKQTGSARAENVFAIAEKKRQKRTTSDSANGGTDKSAAEDTELVPAELQSMIAEYMSSDKSQQVSVSPGDSDKETEDYVFDVYYSDDKAGPVANGSIGYIDVDEDQEKLIFGDSDSDAAGSFLGEEEDSNAEDYYKNEYPEDEDEEEEGEFGSDLDELLGDKMGDLHLDPEWSEDEEEADSADASFNRYGWR